MRLRLTFMPEDVLESEEMIADHIIIKIKAGKSRADLKAINDRRGHGIREVVRIPDTFLVDLNRHDVRAVPVALRRDGQGASGR